ncbi:MULTISPECIES: hypothetical protein [Streptomyces]|uniref:hypothetical protein n=1 Tax=Streptomyces TaxID=1883 RepID=UPI00331D5D8C
METDTPSIITPPAAPVLMGSEPIRGAQGLTVSDFWRYGMPDLRSNTARGLLAQFLVHHAIGAKRQSSEWECYDIEGDNGLRIEVKASARLQAWEQRGLSPIRFSGLKRRTWSPAFGSAEKATYNADVYVFAVQTATAHDLYDPLDVAQWEFYVAARSAVAARNQVSMGLSTVQGLASGPVAFDALRSAIEVVAKEELQQSGGV